MLETKVGVYVHIPFCVRKCPYCDFNSYAGKDALRGCYVDALCREVAMAAEVAARAGEKFVASTLFIGGGTPTLLPDRELERILATCEKYLGWNSRAETTIEANPGTIDSGGALELRRVGINRVSLGIQSLDEPMLRRLGRIHTVKDALNAYDACRAAGFENVNLDLMYALPDQSFDHWEKTLVEAVGLAPEHLSLYPLTIEEGTVYHRLWSEGGLPIPGDDEAALMYEAAVSVLAEAGYAQYEISNWALAGADLRCQHNLTYWTNRPYLGFGAGAHSYVHSRRFFNVLGPEGYIGCLQRGDVPLDQGEDIGVFLEMKETVILGLRLVDGIDRREFALRFSVALDQVFGTVIARLVADGLVLDREDRIALTSRGRLLANEAFVAFLSANVDRESCE